MGEGLFPVRGDLALDEPAFGLAFGCAAASFLFLPLSGSFVLDVADREPEQFHDRVIVREVATVLGDFAQFVVPALRS